MTDILDLDGAAALLHVSAQTIRKQAAAGKLPGAKVGRSWIFIKSDLLAHIRRLTESRQDAKTTIEPTQRINTERKSAPRTRRRTLPCIDSYMLLTK